MKAYIKPNTLSFSIVSSNLIAASKEIGVTTPMGGFYYCSKPGCKTKNPLKWSDTASDYRDKRGNYSLSDWDGEKIWQYIGCYEYKSNGSGIEGEDFYGTYIKEGTQWDLYINAKGEYLVESCPNGVH